MKPAVTFPDVEHLVVEYLEPLLDDVATVSVGVPGGWTPAALPHVEVALDGTPAHVHPVLAHHTIRLVARAGLSGESSPTESKRIAQLAQGLLLAHPGGGGIAGTRKLTGLLVAVDPTTHHDLAATTTRVTVRSTPIPA